MMQGHIVILISSVQALHSELRNLGIPPLPFLRRGVTVVMQPREAQGTEAPWAVAPHRTPTEMELATMHANTRCPETSFHELIARQLAWRLWHEQ